MLLLDVSHTSHTASQSGIQQVTRQLYRQLSRLSETVPIVYDPFRRGWRLCDRRERAYLELESHASGARKRRAHWSLWQKLRGAALAGLPSDIPQKPCRGILVPEIPLPRVPDAAYEQLRQSHRTQLFAVFHDAIALRFPDITPRKTVQYYPRYLERICRFDAIAAVSEASRQDLLRFAPATPPPSVTLHLGSQARASEPPRHGGTTDDSPNILCVGTLEARKNHLELLQACQSLWERGYRFRLTLVGGYVPETAKPAMDRLRDLASSKRPIAWLGPVSENRLLAAYRECDFTIYPSLYEGFGLPVLESLRHGKPCICSTAGGLAEVVPGGGCLALEDTSAKAIEKGLARLLDCPDQRAKLAAEARNRSLRSWEDYAKDLLAWVEAFPPKPLPAQSCSSPAFPDPTR